MPDFIFKEQEINELVLFINDKIPTKFGRPLLEYIETIDRKRQAEAEKEEQPQVSDEKEDNSPSK